MKRLFITRTLSILSVSFVCNIFGSYDEDVYKSDIFAQSGFNSAPQDLPNSEKTPNKILVESERQVLENTNSTQDYNQSATQELFTHSTNFQKSKLKDYDIAKFELMKDRLVTILQNAIETKDAQALENFQIILSEVELPDELQLQILCTALEKIKSKNNQTIETLKKLGINACGIGTGVLAFVVGALVYKIAKK